MAENDLIQFNIFNENNISIEYANFEEMLQINALILNVFNFLDASTRYHIDVKPSESFQLCTPGKKVPFSLMPLNKKPFYMDVGQFELMVSRLSGYSFHYSDQIFIQDNFWQDNQINHATLKRFLHTNSDIEDYFNMNSVLNKVTICYINPDKGFGVFSQHQIEKGTFIGFYSGIKKYQDDKPIVTSYAFKNQNDALNLYLDGRQYGNFTRFINGSEQHANVLPISLYKNGIEFVVLVASKTIAVGEQLLMDYGESYFKQPYRNDDIITSEATMKKQFRIKQFKKYLHHLHIMSDFNIVDVQQKLYTYRLFIFVAVLMVLLSILSWV